eukprot:scaffold24668_cov24-Tisochrysis_lutea.AAC.1
MHIYTAVQHAAHNIHRWCTTKPAEQYAVEATCACCTRHPRLMYTRATATLSPPCPCGALLKLLRSMLCRQSALAHAAQATQLQHHRWQAPPSMPLHPGGSAPHTGGLYLGHLPQTWEHAVGRQRWARGGIRGFGFCYAYTASYSFSHSQQSYSTFWDYALKRGRIPAPCAQPPLALPQAAAAAPLSGVPASHSSPQVAPHWRLAAWSAAAGGTHP